MACRHGVAAVTPTLPRHERGHLQHDRRSGANGRNWGFV